MSKIDVFLLLLLREDFQFRRHAQHSGFGWESPDLKANSDLPSAFCFISQSPAFH